MTEMKLKSDVLVSTNNGLMNEKSHLTTELKETRELYRTYEAKCGDLTSELHKVTTEYQELKRAMISYDEETKLREETISQLRKDLDITKRKLEDIHIEFGTLTILHEKE